MTTWGVPPLMSESFSIGTRLFALSLWMIGCSVSSSSANDEGGIWSDWDAKPTRILQKDGLDWAPQTSISADGRFIAWGSDDIHIWDESRQAWAKSPIAQLSSVALVGKPCVALAGDRPSGFYKSVAMSLAAFRCDSA